MKTGRQPLREPSLQAFENMITIASDLPGCEGAVTLAEKHDAFMRLSDSIRMMPRI